jgi:magnesium chelatase family protein
MRSGAAQPTEAAALRSVLLHARAVFPARFMLVASMNPCSCGWHGDPRCRCRCTPNEVRRYQAKLSGPLLDRFDLAVEVPAVDPGDLSSAAAVEASERVRDRVQRPASGNDLGSGRWVPHRLRGWDGPSSSATPRSSARRRGSWSMPAVAWG